MRDAAKLMRLHALTETQFLAVQTEMSELSRQEQQLRENLAALSKSVTSRAALLEVNDDPARIAGADIRWHRWVDQRKTTINTQLANLLARQEHCRARLQEAFGKTQVADKLLTRVKVKEEKIRKNRIGYES